MAKGGLFRFLDGYETRSITGKGFLSVSYSGAVTREKQRIKEMRFFGFLEKMSRGIAATSSQVYGAAALTYGILTVLVHILKDYFLAGNANSLSALIIGIVFSVLAIPLLLFDKPISEYFQEFRLTDFIFYEFFCIKRTYTNGEEPTLPLWVAISLSAILALLGYFVPAWFISAVFVACVFAYVSVLSPEFAFFSSQLMLPYLNFLPDSKIIFSAVVGIAALSFLRKAFSGKRAIFFEQYDLLLALMLLCVMVSGIFVKGIESFTDALIMVTMALGYFLSSNIVTNRRLADCTLNATVVSSIPVSLIAFGQAIYYASKGRFVEEFSDGISSTFEYPDVFAVFLLVSIIFGAALTKQSHHLLRSFYAFTVVINFLALLLTGEAFAVLAVIIAAIVYFLMQLGGAAKIFIPILFLVPYAVFLIPSELKASLFDFLPTTLDLSELLELWRATVEALRAHPFFGIGIGEECFSSEMAQYGIYGVGDAHNLFLSFSVYAGIPAVLMLILLLIVRLRHRAVYSSYVKRSQVRRIAPMMSVCIFSLLCFGATDYIWSDFSTYYLFWCVFGLGSATLRVAKKEHDDRVLYYEDTRRTYSSALDVHIR